MTTVAASAPPSSTFPSPHSFSSSSRRRRRRHQLRPRSTNPGSKVSSPRIPPLDLDNSNSSFLSTFSPHSRGSPSPADASPDLLSSCVDGPIGSDPFFIDTTDAGVFMPQALGFPQSNPTGAPLPLPNEALSDSIRAWAQPATLGPAGVVANAAANAHRRQQSSSSIGSTVASSISTYPPSRVVDYDKVASLGSQNFSHNQSSAQHLPTPSVTPTRPAAAMNLPPHSQSIDSTVAASMAMTGSLLGPRQAGTDSMVHLVRPATSSLGPEPRTPMTVVSDYHDEAQRRQTGEKECPDIDVWLEQYLREDDELEPLMMPKLGRTITDAYSDELYFPQSLAVSQPPSASFLLPQNNQMVQNRLNAAHMARSTSGSSSQSAAAPISAFKANAPYMQSQLQAMPEGARDAQDLRYTVSPHSDSEPKTISPQEALLDHEASAQEIALFSENNRNYGMFAPPATTASSQAFQTPTTMAFGDTNAAMGPWTSTLVPPAMSSAPLQTYGGFAAPALPASLSTHGMAHSFMSPSTRTMTRPTESTPEFPAHLVSMESSASEAAPPSSAASSTALLSPSKPNTGADTGTYSCTYHGCTQRFSTPQKLQKHKRDVHRANPNVTPGVGSGMTAAQLMERNSQSGPHKCERINPTTGKPCNTIFSRPYDLTRHEDTIHNIRKQKVRCALCTEEKTFSRSDALTRHMRVVHPEVDFPGKHRRRGGRD